MKISTATKQGSPSCEFPGSQPLSPSQSPPWLPVGIACTSILPISNPIAAPSDREGPSLVPPLMRTGLLALDLSTFLFGIAYTARCKAMLFIAPLRFASAALRDLNATSASKKYPITKRKSPACTFRRSVLEVRTVGVTLLATNHPQNHVY